MGAHCMTRRLADRQCGARCQQSRRRIPPPPRWKAPRDEGGPARAGKLLARKAERDREAGYGKAAGQGMPLGSDSLVGHAVMT